MKPRPRNLHPPQTNMEPKNAPLDKPSNFKFHVGRDLWHKIACMIYLHTSIYSLYYYISYRRQGHLWPKPPPQGFHQKKQKKRPQRLVFVRTPRSKKLRSAGALGKKKQGTNSKFAPENRPSQKENSLPTIHFQVLCQFQGGYSTVSWTAP